MDPEEQRLCEVWKAGVVEINRQMEVLQQHLEQFVRLKRAGVVLSQERYDRLLADQDTLRGYLDTLLDGLKELGTR